jgi:NAD(P)-dependent dehydrogenase (short-subunit alcohol dehydrogenase family)
MTTPQHRIDSGFGRDSTAAEVLEGISLENRYAIVTGGYSGIGIETVRALTAAGAEVMVPARRPDRAESALAGLPGVEVEPLDLADLDSVRVFAERFLARDRAIDLLMNNAGIMAAPETRVGPGWEFQFATNHLGHFALTNRLWPAVARGGGARVVALTSSGHRLSDIRFDDLMFEHGYDKWQAYGQSKTANSLFAVELDRLGHDAGVRAFAVHPGGIRRELSRFLTEEELAAAGFLDEHGNPKPGLFKTPEQGAATTLWAATSPQLDGLGGVYCADCDIADVMDEDAVIPPGGPGVFRAAVDPENAARLWAVSAELTGVNAFAAA